MTEDYIKSKIKGREVVYYLTTEEDLNDIKTKSIFGDIFILLFSCSLGGIISIFITKSISELSPEALGMTDVLNIVFIIACVIFGLFASYFYCASFSAIKRIKGSGEIKSFSKPESAKSEEFQIMEAIYGTEQKSQNITDKLQSKVQNNKLSLFATNEIAGDPHPDHPKKLTIKYQNNGVIFNKEFNEGAKIELP